MLNDHRYDKINKEYPIELDADRETAELFRNKYVDGHLVILEGTIAMFAAAFLAGVVVLHFYGGLQTGHAVSAALLAGVVGAATELLSPSEWDTVTVPVAILIVLLVTV